MPPNLFLIILLIINIATLDGQITLSNMGDWNELSHAEIVEESRKMCNLLRKKDVNETNKWEEDNKPGEVPIPVGWHNCLLFNLSSGFRGDKEILKQPPPSTSLPEGKLAIAVEKFEVEHADNVGMEEIAVGKLNVLVHLVLSWEDKRLAQMIKMEHPIQLADLDWIWTPTLASADYCGYFSDCFIKKVAVFLCPNQRVRALYTLRLREQCKIEHSRFPTEVANCERQISFVPEKNVEFQCQNEKGFGLSEEEYEYFERKMKVSVHVRAGIEDYGMVLLAEAKKSKKWQPEENSIECGLSEEKCTPKEECAKRFGNVMTLKMRIVQERGPMATISLCAIPLLAIMAFYFRRASANTALAFLFVPMFCLFMASLQYPLHGFPNGPPKILKFYNATFFIASANLLCFLIVQLMKKIDNDIFPFPFPYRWLLLAKFLNELPGKLFKWQPADDERLVEDSAEGHGEDVEIVEMANGNGPNSAGNGKGNEAASNLEMWILLDKMLASILAFCFVYLFIWTIG